jgi:hypothetical protein
VSALNLLPAVPARTPVGVCVCALISDISAAHGGHSEHSRFVFEISFVRVAPSGGQLCGARGEWHPVLSNR